MSEPVKVGDLIEAESVDGAWEEFRVAELVPASRGGGSFRVEVTSLSFGPLARPKFFTHGSEGALWRRKTRQPRSRAEDFMECDACRAQPGSSTPCGVIARFLVAKEDRDRLLVANANLHKDLDKAERELKQLRADYGDQEYKRIGFERNCDALYGKLERLTDQHAGCVVALKNLTDEKNAARAAEHAANASLSKESQEGCLSPGEQARKLAFIVHVVFCEACTSPGMLAPYERRVALGMKPSLTDSTVRWHCAEGIALARAAEK